MSFSYLQLFVVDDTVLEEHYEDPALVHIIVLGDGGIVPQTIHTYVTCIVYL